MIIESGRVVDTGAPAQLKSRFGTVVFSLGFAAEADATAAAAVLAAAGWTPERDRIGLRVRSDDGSGAITHLLRTLARRVPDPVSVAVREPTLDDVFLALTGHAPASASSIQGGRAA